MSRLICIGNHYGAHEPFKDLFKEVFLAPKNILEFTFKQGDVLLFGGGEDISPTLYKQRPSRYCGATAIISQRDALEKTWFDKAKEHSIPMIGICRGAQLVCALSGGSLYQHVNGHAGKDHNMTTSEGTVLNVCSVHHQMMNPKPTKHKLLAWSTEVRSNVHLVESEKDIPVDIEPEVVFFEDTKALGIQYHPEFMSMETEGVAYAREVVSNFLLS